MPTICRASKQDFADGVAFDFLAPLPGQRVTTGHEGGVITLNNLEADDLHRERERYFLGEPYRTLVGHFRHELGHYYWDCFFRSRNETDPLLVEYRALFGDEREDYSAALAAALHEWPGWDLVHDSHHGLRDGTSVGGLG